MKSRDTGAKQIVDESDDRMLACLLLKIRDTGAAHHGLKQAKIVCLLVCS